MLSTGSWYRVMAPDGSKYECKLRGKMRTLELRGTNPVVVGDRVEFSLPENENPGLITAVHPRENYIIRKASKLSKSYQIIASNLDQAILMVTIARPVTHTEFIDRFLMTAEAYSIPAVLLFNKLDEQDEKQRKKYLHLRAIYEKAGYPCCGISAINAEEVHELGSLFYDKVSLVAGNSGVGKTTLINMLNPELDLKTTSISDHHQSGKHTTTFSEMFPLKEGGYIIDTPGIKGFGLIDMETEPIDHYFPEIFEAAKACKFNNCTHVKEPGCNVIRAVQEGEISRERYQNYRKILSDIPAKYR